jgi:hypothetical protein
LIGLLQASPAPQAGQDLDIRAFGARCDGSDDTAAVQAALDALQDGQTLRFTCIAGIRQVSISGRNAIVIAATGRGGVRLLHQTTDIWARAFSITRCTWCAVLDLTIEGNNKDIVAFNIEESTNSTVAGLTIRDVKHAGAAFLALHNTGNKYLSNTLQNVGMDRGPIEDTTRGMWVGNVSDETMETNVLISDNKFYDISGTALAVHGTGLTITGNIGARLNSSCVKALPLGGADAVSVVAGNNCSGAGAKYWIGGGLMTEYPNSALEKMVIRDNTLEGYSEADVFRVPDSPNNGIGIANPVGLVSHNVEILRNTIRNFLYDGVQITGPTDNFLIEGNVIERTISPGNQLNGISLQGDAGKVITNGVIRRNLIYGKFDGVYMSGNGGFIGNVALDGNTVVSITRDGVHMDVRNGGEVSGIELNGNCFASIGNRVIGTNSMFPPWHRVGLAKPDPAISSSCSDPRLTAR